MWPDQSGVFPWTTFGINVSGAFVLALLLVLILGGVGGPDLLRPLAGTGFLGAFTHLLSVAFALERFAAAKQWRCSVPTWASRCLRGWQRRASGS